MADNIDKGLSDNETNTFANKTEAVNTNQKTGIMEGKKSLKSYFKEFIMLFLAVFCGFLAEYSLEHMLDKETEKEYIISFYNDLKYDTAHLTNVINSYRLKTEGLKDIPLCYDSVMAKSPCNSCLMKLLSRSQSFYELRVSDRTMLQLKNAGGLRLLQSDDADSILAYDNSIRGFKLDETTAYQETQTTIRNITSEVFNFAALKSPNPKGHRQLLVSDDKIIINKYFMTLRRYAIYSDLYVIKLVRLKSDATKLMNYLNKKYQIE